jgi:hypothetical protein
MLKLMIPPRTDLLTTENLTLSMPYLTGLTALKELSKERKISNHTGSSAILVLNQMNWETLATLGGHQRESGR